MSTRKDANEIRSTDYKITVRMTRHEREVIDKAAKEENKTISEYVRVALRLYELRKKTIS